MSALSSNQEILPVESRHWWPKEVWWHNRTDSWRDWCMGEKKAKTRDDGDISVSAQDYTEGELYFKRQRHKERGYWWVILLLVCAETCWYVQLPILQMAGNRNNVCSPQHNVLFERIESEATHKEEQNIYCRTPQSICKSSSSLLGICLFKCCVCCFTFSVWKGEAAETVVVIALYPQGRQNKLDSLSRNNSGSKLFFSSSLRRCLVKHFT